MPVVQHVWGKEFPGKGQRVLEIDDQAKEIVRDIGTAINESVENSTKVAEAIERLREAGYEMELTLRLEIGLRPTWKRLRKATLA